MVYQIDTGLHPYIRKYGCAILSTLYLTGREWTVNQINELYNTALHDGTIDAHCTITWVPWCELIGLQWIGFQSSDYICAPGELELQKWWSDKSHIFHFVVGNGAGSPAWDPYPSSLTVRTGKLIDKRIFKHE